MIFRHEFVSSVPEKMEEQVLYISIPFCTTMHLCPCGCRTEIANKLSPVRWELTFNGDHVSLNPSIGNWILPCQSHYWIHKNEIIWAETWSDKKIRKNKKKDEKANKKQQKKKNKRK